LVLGAGGLTGQAFHAGVLRALAEETGWDPRSASDIVGTSAGSSVGAYLRVGLSAADYAAMKSGLPLSAEGEALSSRHGVAGDWWTKEGGWSWPQLPDRRLLSRFVKEPHRVRPEAVLAVMVPAGRIDTETWTAAMRDLFGPTWSRAPLWIPAVRVDDARRVVFGRAGAPATDMATAIGASSAIPGWFKPVEIAGRSYIDGGTHSPTNADILRDESLDLVIVSSPMSTATKESMLASRQAVRRHFRMRLGMEVRKLREAGVPVLVLQPSDADLEVMGNAAMDESRSAAVVEQAHETTARRVNAAHNAEALELLAA
jgi:NTE family protein